MGVSIIQPIIEAILWRTNNKIRKYSKERSVYRDNIVEYIILANPSATVKKAV
jgi:hypothetical protein